MTANRFVLGTAAMLALAPLDWPYAYYVLLRVGVTVTAGFLAYGAWQQQDNGWALTFGAVAVLYNPFAPMHLGREGWIPLNIGAAALFLFAWRKAKLVGGASPS